MKFSFKIHDLYLGTKEFENPKDDVKQYLVIDELDARPHSEGKDTKIFITINKNHIKERPIEYCEDCLKQGIRNPRSLYVSKEEGMYCIDHYAQSMREKKPENACPSCNKGYLRVGGFEGETLCCTHCDYKKPNPNHNPTHMLFSVYTDKQKEER